MLTIDEIRAKTETRWTISVPEWGGDVLAKRLSLTDYEQLYDGKAGESERFSFLVKIVRLSLINEDGSAFFTDENAELIDLNIPAVTRIGTELVDKNGIDRNAKKN